MDEKRLALCVQPSCFYATPFVSALANHVKTTHNLTVPQKFSCSKPLREYTDKVRETSRLQSHFSEHNCLKCNFQSHSLMIFQKHWTDCSSDPAEISIRTHRITRNHVNVDQTIYQCGFCTFRTVRQIKLENHVLYKHTEGIGIRFFYCQDCDYRTTQTAFLRRHGIYRHTNPEDIIWFYCKQCNYKAKEQCEVNRHVKKKHQINDTVRFIVENQCHFCTFTCRYKTDLQRHLKNYHNMLRTKIQCSLCNFTCRYENQLKRHVKVTHDVRRITIKPTPSDNNGEEKIQRPHISQNHKVKKPKRSENNKMKANTKQQLVGTKKSKILLRKCESCKFVCRNYFRFKRHVRTHHTVTYTCPLCSFQAKHNENLETHVEERHRFRCEVCQVVCRTKAELNRHMKSIHNEYNCRKCGFCCSSVLQLRKHDCLMCSHCVFYCSSRDNLILHILNKHFL